MVNRIVLSILVGVIAGFLCWLVGTLLLPVVPVIAGIFISIYYGVGIVLGLWYAFSDSRTTQF